ncbi:ABC transporter ATP-binding protein [Sporanaerobacter acetigenes]|uniref:ABC-type multidrug transport system, ATPase component n=1 Tax=Sporanaerobacter acetigenes DSM 13106 TaxID=1123281 RepID=A0A1M5XF35_9FIRM|nr:ABC transporter ATP-binding protein [Sporanaerobacter acetigenes]SHH97823.1 ABC-type multidrug transport system, ATPase component [Sporanaerobacter acetigenes DSM 13106]
MNIKLENISKKYKSVKALDNINLEINSPAMIGFVGPNGAGKSTLMKMLVGQLLPTSGSITVDGVPLNKNEKHLKERLGYLPQDFGLYEELTVEEFLDYMACLKGIKENKEGSIDRVISMTSLEEKRKFRIKTLSGGQKQRVGIAQAILNDPELLIVDEPTVGLDPEERIKFRNLFSEGSKDRMVILSTHIIEDIESICNSIIVLNKGNILFVGQPSELVKEALDHVGTIEIKGNDREKILESEMKGEFKITSTVITPNGTKYRVVSESLPSSFEKITPSLEDAYVYCMLKGEVQNGK